jgi:hypothetical protein
VLTAPGNAAPARLRGLVHHKLFFHFHAPLNSPPFAGFSPINIGQILRGRNPLLGGMLFFREISLASLLDNEV